MNGSQKTHFSYVGWFDKPSKDELIEKRSKFEKINDFELPNELPNGIEARLWKSPTDEDIYFLAVIHHSQSDDPQHWEELDYIKCKMEGNKIKNKDVETTREIIEEIKGIKMVKGLKESREIPARKMKKICVGIVNGDVAEIKGYIYFDHNNDKIQWGEDIMIRFYISNSINPQEFMLLSKMAEKFGFIVSIFPFPTNKKNGFQINLMISK